MAAAKGPKTTKRERIIRVLWAVGGAFGAAILAVGVNVVSEQINNVLDLVPSNSSCPPTTSNGYPLEGEQYVEVLLRHDEAGCWAATLTDVSPGDVFQMMIHYRNFTGEKQEGVALRAALPEEFAYVPGSTEIVNSSTDGEWVPEIDGIASTGVVVGSYLNGGNVALKFEVRMNPSMSIPCEFVPWPLAAYIDSAVDQNRHSSIAGVITLQNC